MTRRKPPAPGEYVTDEKVLLQVLTLDEEYLLCEDVQTSADRPAPLVKIKLADLSARWRRVRPARVV